MVAHKRVAFRRKDLGHLEDIIVRQGVRLDLSYLRIWAQRLAALTAKFEIPGTLGTMLAEQGL